MTTLHSTPTAAPAFTSRAMHPDAAEYAESIAHVFTVHRYGPVLLPAARIAERAVDLSNSHRATVKAHTELAAAFGEADAAQVEARMAEAVTEAARCVLIAAGYDAAKVAPVDYLPLAFVLLDQDPAGVELDREPAALLSLVADALPEA